MKRAAALFFLLGAVVPGLQAQPAAPARQQYVIVLRPVPRLIGAAAVWTSEDERLVGAHFARLQRLTAEGIVVFAGRTLNNDAQQFGLVVVEVASESEARVVMEDDPAVKGGVMTGQLFPYHLALKR